MDVAPTPGQSPAKTSRRSGSFASAPWRSISLRTLSRPRRLHFEHATSSIGSRSAISPSVTAPLLLIGLDSPCRRHVAIFRSMPLPDVAPEQYAELTRVIREAIDRDRSPRTPQ